MTYCIDTSAVIDAGERYYPIDVFPHFWSNLEALAAAGRLKAPQTLLDELRRQSDQWRQWVYDREDLMIVPVNGVVAAELPRVIAVYAAAGIPADRLTGDPFFVATALAHNLILVTSERMRRGGRSMPEICAAAGAQSISLIGMARSEGWRF